MQIVIDIPDFLYQIIQDCKVIEGTNEGNLENVLIKAVENGVALPKGHGRLIDADKMKTMKNIQSANFNAVELIRYWIDNQPTIIEKDGD